MRAPSLSLLGALAFFAALSAYLLWPLPRHATETVLDGYRLDRLGGAQVHADNLLNTWIMAWDCHALAHDPLKLFSPNAFHPTPMVLTLSEHLLGNLPVFAPVYAATGNPILAHNVTMLASYAVAGLSMFWLIRAWTCSFAAGLFAGCLFAFCPWRLREAAAHYSWLNFQYLPLVLLTFDRVGRGPAIRGVAAAAAILVLQALCSYYVGYAAFAAAAVFGLVHAASSSRASRRPLLSLLALASAALVLVPISLPYLRQQAAGVLLFEQIPGWRSLVWQEGRPLALTMRYLSPLTLVFAGVGLTFVLRACDQRARALGLLAVAVTGYAFSPGPGPGPFPPDAWPIPTPYAVAQKLIPGLAAVRDSTRFGVLVLLGLTGLAGLGAASLLQVFGPRWRRGAGLAVVMIGIWTAWATALATPYPLRRVETGADVPSVYRWLADHGEGGPLLELPVYERRGFDFRGMVADARAMYFSIVHWLPLVNGYSGYSPPEHAEVMDAARRLPDPEALALLVRATGLRWILVHEEAGLLPTAPRLADLPGVRVRGHFGGDVLYEVTFGRDRAAAVRDAPRRSTTGWVPSCPRTHDVAEDALGPVSSDCQIRARS